MYTVHGPLLLSDHSLFDLFVWFLIADRVIASSFPSSGRQALYRNPIEEVGRFLDTKHKDHYKVYNLCSKLILLYLSCCNFFLNPFGDNEITSSSFKVLLQKLKITALRLGARVKP